MRCQGKGKLRTADLRLRHLQRLVVLPPLLLVDCAAGAYRAYIWVFRVRYVAQDGDCILLTHPPIKLQVKHTCKYTRHSAPFSKVSRCSPKDATSQQLGIASMAVFLGRGQENLSVNHELGKFGFRGTSVGESTDLTVVPKSTTLVVLPV